MSVEVRPLLPIEIPRLEAAVLRPENKHRERYTLQERGNGVYFIAWDERVVVGQLLLIWPHAYGPRRRRMYRYPRISDLHVVEHRRSQGIGTVLMQTAEAHARDYQFRQIGLGVGVHNHRAQALYARRGYRDAGFGKYAVRYLERHPNGQVEVIREDCRFLLKRLE